MVIKTLGAGGLENPPAFFMPRNERLPGQDRIRPFFWHWTPYFRSLKEWPPAGHG
jgi:hypothetical protein